MISIIIADDINNETTSSSSEYCKSILEGISTTHFHLELEQIERALLSRFSLKYGSIATQREYQV